MWHGAPMTVITPEVSLDPDQVGAGDVTHFWRVPRYRGLDCLRATFRRHAYARHSHDTYAIAAVLAGCETFFHRGEQHYAPAGSVAVVCPDEIHDGEPYGGGFEYRTFYPSAELMQEIAEDVAGRPLSRAALVPAFRDQGSRAVPGPGQAPRLPLPGRKLDLRDGAGHPADRLS